MEGIAIIGMSGRFPGAPGVDAFWDNLVRGVESISRFSPAELEMPPPPDAGAAFVNARGIVENADMFDAAFFGCNAREAELLDPQHRVFLECAWEALENAGYDPERYPGLIGVWAGSGINSYLLYNIVGGHGDLAQLVGGYQQGESPAQFSNDRDFLATRLAYKLNLKGPAMTVQTACSTSLVAVAQACQALWSYATDMALAGGVSISFPQRRGYVYQEGAIASADGHTRTFDAAAQGTVFSSGAGIVLLKRLEDARADGDRIIAVIKGTAINNDGAGKVSFTAPSVDGQAEVIRQAQALADVPPESVSYIEAHGTGTPLGDPIEVAGLTQAFRAGGATGNNFCALGSLKTNVGHMDIASGVAGLIKTALALQHRLLPATLHFQTANPYLDLCNSPFHVNTQLTDWRPGEAGQPLRAGVSSFGVGGTNVHAVLEEAPPSPVAEEALGRGAHLLVLSARSAPALDAATRNLAAHLEANPHVNLANVSFTLQMGRRAFGHRRIAVCRDAADAAAALTALDPKRVFAQVPASRNAPVAFLFPGQGAQAVQMGADLYRTEAVFRQEIDRCAELLQPRLRCDLRTVLYPAPGGEAEAAARLNQTALTQPALFVFGYALARLWMSWGVQPAALLGHSVGEYVAACFAGVFSIEDALMLVAERARLVQAQPGGVMLAVRQSEEEVAARLRSHPELSLAAVNAPNLCVVSGPDLAVAAFERACETERVASRRLTTSHAFHSAMMDPVVAPFTALFERIQLRAPGIPFVSNLTGTWITEAQATDPHYWAGHLRHAVRFADGVESLLQDRPEMVLLEAGPGATLAPLVKQHPAARQAGAVLASLQEGKETVLQTLGRLWLAGVPVDWAGFQTGTPHRRVPLPTYPFERQRFWIEPAIISTEVSVAAQPAPAPIGGQTALEEVSMAAPVTTTPSAPPPARKPLLIAKIRAILKNLSGQDQQGADVSVTFLELGFDSLLLTQVAQAFRKEFGLKVTFRQLLEDYSTIETLAVYLDAQLPPEVMAPPAPTAVAPAAPMAPVNTPAPATGVVPAKQTQSPSPPPLAGLPREAGAMERIINEQLRLMGEQLAVLRGHPALPDAMLPATDVQAAVSGPFAPAAPASPKTPALPAKIEAKAFGPYKPIDKAPGGGLTEKQQRHLDALIARYTARTPKSKQQTQATRAHFADPRTVSGFRQQWKEAVYPIVVEHSAGSRFRDIDGNEYVDVTMGFGTNLLGHSPGFITAALEAQLERGIEVGPQSPIAGNVAALLCELTGCERAAFTNTGSEAILAAVRLARTVTGRTRIATCGGFHGINDEVLVRATVVDGERRSVPVAPGIPEHIVQDVLVLDYGTPEGLELLRAHAHEIAAVLVEPVQSRRPDLQPREFMHALREITAQAGCALVFDEIISGFRCHPRGAQGYFGVDADIVTYGKIIGGGMPIGAVCGKAEYLDALDGGMWQYGDGSFPEVGVTFFAGTYIRHPLTMAASWAVLNYLKSQGPALQETLNARNARLVGELNSFFTRSGVPLRLENFSSLFLPHFDDDIKYGGLLFLHLREKGLHLWEGRPCFLSTAHTEEDVAFIIRVFKESVRELQVAGFLPGEPLEEGTDQSVNGAHGTNGTNGTNGHHAPAPVQKRAITPVAQERVTRATANPSLTTDRRLPVSARPLQFSLYYFGNYPADYREDKYDLIFKGAQFADENGFTAVWLPERHFHAVGGFSPNPSLLAAALARETTRLQLRGGSVVLPLHHPVRVAEEWALVDNLSHGRTGISIASGWHPNDFIFAPERFERRREILLEDVATIQKLWRGESLPMRCGTGAMFDVQLFPMPVQPQLPVWLTCIHEDSFVKAGEQGLNVLGYLMNQTVDEVAAKIVKYREARAQAGHDPETGHVTILVHTFIGEDADAARAKAKQPLCDYLRSFLDNIQKRIESHQGAEVEVEESDIEYLLERSFNDYVQGKALIGSPESCSAVVDRLREIGVDEIGCFLDFGVDPAAVLASLPALNALRERYAQPAAPAPAALPRELALTEAQSGLWVLGQTDPDALRAYYESTTLEWRGPLDVAALQRAVQTAADRHEALRTTIRPDGEAQIIHPRLTVEVPLLDLCGYAADEQPALVAECYWQLEHRPFDFAKGPMLQTQLIRLEAEHHLLVLTFHHLLGNGPSYWVYLEDLTDLYEREIAGRPAALAPAMQLSDYTVWRAEQAGDVMESEAFWLAKFDGTIPVLELPADRSRPALRTHKGAREILVIEKELVTALRKTAAARRGSLFMLLLAAFEVLMHRLSGQDDVVVGVPFEGEARSLPGGDKLFANTTNVLPLRSRVAAQTSFAELLGATKDFVFEANEHQNYFFGRLIRKLNLPHDASRSPVFAAFFNYESGKFQRTLASGVTAELLTDGSVPYRSPRDTAMFELYLNVAEKDGALHCECDHGSDLFDGATVARWLGHYRTLLEAIVANPDASIWQMPLLGAAERAQIVEGFNATQADYHNDVCLHELIEQQAQRTPDAAALIYEGVSLTYRELTSRANQLAHYLGRFGVGPETLAGIAMERSPEMVVGLLAILKAGAAYVPLDPDYPAERLAFMVADARVPVLLTQQRILTKLPSNNARLLCVDTEWEAIAQESAQRTFTAVTPDNLAYVIYTSGSTGQPKGAMNAHRGICNRLLWMQEAYRLQAGDRVLQKTPFSFDVSVWEFFWPLLAGATLVVAKAGGHQDTRYLADTIARERVTTMHFVPPMLAAFLDEPGLAAKCISLRQVICSGEALPPELAQRFFQVFGRTSKLHNLYGPTEAAVDVTYWECQADQAVVPIGRPVANTQMYVLDAHGQPAPIGVPGELLIGGVQVGRGYWGRPELTAEKFIADPFRDDPRARLYRTGDLARWRADGALIYLGRSDHQVKIRGFRIEPEEIESVLGTHPQVRQSVVVARADGPGERRLVAYIVPPANDEFSADAAAHVEYWRGQWEQLHQSTIEQASPEENPSHIFLRWIHVDNPAEQQREFASQTVQRVRELKPARVYEIGCGNGALVRQLWAECEAYWASDFSAAAIDYVRRELLAPNGELPPGVRFFQRAADDFSGIEPASFDMVLIHSVLQYFPDAAYLRRVLEGAVRATRPGGCVYVGAVQSLALFEMYHASLQAQRAPADLPLRELKSRIEKRLLLGDEFTVDTGFFHALAGEVPEITAVATRLRRGKYHNKSTKFVYDAFLHVGEAPAWVPVDDWREGRGQSLDDLRRVLTAEKPETVGFHSLMNARLQAEVQALAFIQADTPGTTVGDLAAAIQAHGSAGDPEHLWTMGEELGYHVAVNWPASGVLGEIDAVFSLREGLPVFPAPFGYDPIRPLHGYASGPRNASAGSEMQPHTLHGEFAASLRDHLRARLPEYMVPAAFVALPALPLSPNGKVDRRALPAPDFSRDADPAAAAHTPATPLETYLATLWAEVLGVPRVGTQDHFFESGGDSLLGLRIVNRLRQDLDEHVSLVVMFEAPTVAALAKLLEGNYAAAVAKLCGLSSDRAAGLERGASAARLDESDVARMRRIVGYGQAPAQLDAAKKNLPAVFILSPMRSGSTLLRIMLAGNSRLFSPPELQLLQFDTLAERRDAFTGYERYLQEGTVRALMQIYGIDLAGAEQMMAERQAADWSVREFYREMQGAITPRLLVDKTPDYAMDLNVLRRAEGYFNGALYIHLARHPLGMIRSYEQGRFLLESPYRGRHDFSARQMAELTWLISHRNILDFLQEVPAERQRVIRFEDTVGAPEAAMQALGEFLGVGYEPGMVQPYENGGVKMTDGTHQLSTQVGDANFYKHGALNPETAGKWKAEYTQDFLSAATWEVAARFGYENPFRSGHSHAPATAAGNGTHPAKSETNGALAEPATARIDERDVAQLRRIIGRKAAPVPVPRAEKNPPAVFILSPMRSGSTLLRVMLAGNPRLFSPPELQLLQFGTLAERRDAFTGYEHSMLESTVRALMQIHGVDPAAAEAMMAERENAGATTRDFYREMQAWVAPGLLVDKTPEYAMDLEILRRAEAFFDGALYLHLARHPLGMIRSYEKGHFLLASPYRGKHDFSARQMAELTWLISHRNIFDFLREVPAERQRVVRFEDMVASAPQAMQAVGEFLGVGYDPGMVQPYEEGHAKMTDGAHEQSAQVGDPNFFKHRSVKAEVAGAWKTEYNEDFLSAATWEVAARFGYENPFAGQEAPLPEAARPAAPVSTASTAPIVAVSREGRRVKRSALAKE
jgi:iturin family lipopeptide synthetase A